MASNDVYDVLSKKKDRVNIFAKINYILRGQKKIEKLIKMLRCILAILIRLFLGSIVNTPLICILILVEHHFQMKTFLRAKSISFGHEQTSI